MTNTLDLCNYNTYYVHTNLISNFITNYFVFFLYVMLNNILTITDKKSIIFLQYV